MCERVGEYTRCSVRAEVKLKVVLNTPAPFPDNRPLFGPPKLKVAYNVSRVHFTHDPSGVHLTHNPPLAHLGPITHPIWFPFPMPPQSRPPSRPPSPPELAHQSLN